MNANIFLRAAELEFYNHEYSCLCIKAAYGDEVYEEPYWQMFHHVATAEEGWWEIPPNEEPNDKFFHQARTYALLLAWAMALEGDLTYD